MGFGYSFRCRKCHKEYSAYLDSGMMYPLEYDRILKEIQAGKYGAKMQEISNTVPGIAVDAESAVFFCDGCKRWKSEPVLSLYAPREDCPAQQNQLDKAPWKSDLERDYRIVYRYYHKCGKCGKRMRRLSSKEAENLPCPKCREMNQGEVFLWD